MDADQKGVLTREECDAVASRRQVRDYLGDAFTPDAQMYKVLIRLALRTGRVNWDILNG